jgi:hypothetical protein
MALVSELKSIFFKVPAMHGQMAPKFIRASKSLGAVGPSAYMRLFSCVGTHVCFEMIRTRELALTYFALEWTDTSVFPAVSPQLIGTREPLTTAFMFTYVWFLSSVLTNVHLKMREFQVTLGAAWIQTYEWFPLFIILSCGHWSGRWLLLVDEISMWSNAGK